jgi:hypothetical protein
MGCRFWLSSAAPILVLAATAPTAAYAQAQPAEDQPVQAAAPAADRQTYPAAYFATFAPSSALDIIRRVPGFAIESGSEDVRGFGGAAGNVVINGARPSSKSESLETILSRIPARRVLRVEVARGEAFGAEFAGRAQVANLVLDATNGLSGNVDVSVRRDFSGRLTPQGTVSALLRRGSSTFNLSAGYENLHRPEEGIDLLNALPSGNLLELREKYNDVDDRLAFVGGSWSMEQGEHRSARLNARFAIGDFILDQSNRVTPSSGPIRDDRLLQDFSRREYEIGGDITRPLAGGGLKLIALLRRRDRENLEESLNRVGSQVTGGFAQETDDRRDEAVARLVWSRTRPGGWSVEAGAEGAFNQLVSDVGFFSIQPGGGRTRIDLPIDQAVVTEYRGEVFFNAGRPLASNLRLDAGLTFEGSLLTVTGDTSAERTLRFFKPRLVLDWQPGDRWRAQLALTRTVAQLDFNDFISAAELANDRVTGGNADLRPQRAWELLATIERPILGDGQARLELGYQQIEQVQDRVPTPEGFDAPGNLGSGRHAFVRGTLDAPLDRFGIPGGRFTVNGTLRHTSVEDPYTNERRRFSGFPDWELRASLRQDRGSFAWGFDYFGGPANRFYRRNEIDVPNALEPFVEAFVEYRVTPQTTVTLRVENLFDVEATRLRTFYLPDRSNREPSLIEYRERNMHRAISLRLRHAFG